MVVEENVFPTHEINAFICGNVQPVKYKNEVQQTIGEIVEVCARNEIRSKIDLASFLHWVKPAILHNQFIFLEREGDISPSGYVLWAWVDEDTLDRYMRTTGFSLHPSEWNEGTNLIVVDFCVHGDAGATISKLYRRIKDIRGLSFRDINICIRNNIGESVKTNKKALYGK